MQTVSHHQKPVTVSLVPQEGWLRSFPCNVALPSLNIAEAQVCIEKSGIGLSRGTPEPPEGRGCAEGSVEPRRGQGNQRLPQPVAGSRDSPGATLSLSKPAPHLRVSEDPARSMDPLQDWVHLFLLAFRSMLQSPLSGISLSFTDSKGAKQMCCIWGLNPELRSGSDTQLPSVDAPRTHGTGLITGLFELPLQSTLLVSTRQRRAVRSLTGFRARPAPLQDTIINQDSRGITTLKSTTVTPCGIALSSESPSPYRKGCHLQGPPDHPGVLRADVNIRCLNVTSLINPDTDNVFGWVGVGDHQDRVLRPSEEQLLLSLGEIVQREIEHVCYDYMQNRCGMLHGCHLHMPWMLRSGFGPRWTCSGCRLCSSSSGTCSRPWKRLRRWCSCAAARTTAGPSSLVSQLPALLLLLPCPASAPACPASAPAACTSTLCVGDRTTRSQHRRPCSRLPSPLPLALWQPMSGGAS